jgi:hypothetical protein
MYLPQPLDTTVSKGLTAAASDDINMNHRYIDYKTTTTHALLIIMPNHSSMLFLWAQCVLLNVKSH